MKYWMPEAAARTLEITPILKPLEPFRDQMTVFGNLSRAGGKNVTDHAVSSAGWLSGAVAKQTEAEDISLGITIDQVLAKQIGQDTLPVARVGHRGFRRLHRRLRARLQLHLHEHDLLGRRDLAAADGDQPARGVRADVRAGRRRRRAPARMRENRSILDSVRGEARQLQRRVGAQDRARLDEYLDNVREIERRIQRTEAANAARRRTSMRPSACRRRSRITPR